MTANENEYDDEAYTTASNDLIAAIGALWEAGGALIDIENDVHNGLLNSGVEATVTISA